MTERSTEQSPVQTRPQDPDGRQDTARIPLAERLQRRLTAAGEERRSAAAPAPATAPRGHTSDQQRVLPPMPPDLQREQQPTAAASPVAQPVVQPQASPPQPPSHAAQPLHSPAPVDQTAAVPMVPGRPAATSRRTSAGPARAPRRARLRLSRIDPWSVMKVSFLLSIAFGIVVVVSVFMVWSVLGAAGVWSSINKTVSATVSSGGTASTFNIENYIGMSRVLGFTMLISVIDVILITAISTLAAFLYNMAASLLGGIEVTLSEDS